MKRASPKAVGVRSPRKEFKVPRRKYEEVPRKANKDV